MTRADHTAAATAATATAIDADALQTLRLERDGAVARVTLDRPEALNAFNAQLMDELTAVMDALDADEGVRCVVVAGSEKAFAAGADIKEMAAKGYPQTYYEDFITANWERTARMRTPVVAAVSGYALGGGCELALMCDFIIAADTAQFGQPEITIGVIPGAGGTQRLARFIGKSKAMDMCLTGRRMKAAEAEACGLVSRVVPAAELADTAMEAAQTIASMPRAAAMMIKESVNAAFETPLSHGIMFERRMFHSLFATADQKEGMAAFTEKRKPAFD